MHSVQTLFNRVFGITRASQVQCMFRFVHRLKPAGSSEDMTEQLGGDRWSGKLLGLPLFDAAFADVIKGSPLANIAFVSAMEAPDASEFIQKALVWSESWGTGKRSVLNDRLVMLEQYWSLCKVSEEAFFRSTAFQIGFGMCESLGNPISKKPKVDRPLAMSVLTLQSTKAPRRTMPGGEAPETSTPLLDKENGLKLKWAARLEQIGVRAGAHSRLLVDKDQSDDLSISEMSKLRQLVLLAGAHRTMAVHIKCFEKFEKWVIDHGLDLYPLSADKVLKYALHLAQQECGPSVLPSVRMSIRWVTSRLDIDCPDLEDSRLMALVQKVVTDRAKTLKEAIPIPIEVVCALERLVVTEGLAPPAKIFVWWSLCMVFASLRFDDAIHVCPKDLKMLEEGLFGIAWQTKVDRKRAGTRFMVPKVGFADSTWLEVGWELFTEEGTPDRDFWIPELNMQTAFAEGPPTYQRSVQWLKYFARTASDLREVDHSRKHQDALIISKLTAHSCRVTLLDAAVHAGRSTEEIGLQANWKNPGPLVLKYTRNRSQVPATMVKQLVNDLVAQKHPVQDDQEGDLVDNSERDLSVEEFYVKVPSNERNYEYKFHAVALHDSSVLACGRFALDECSQAGNTLPDLAVLCKACARSRPDLVAFYKD